MPPVWGILPLEKAMDDSLLALFQNGEPVRPNRATMRLFNPGWEGNTSVKWLTQIKVTRKPQFRDETSKYTDTLPDRSSLQFTFPMDVKSLITSPSGQMRGDSGIYRATGIAWSGAGSIRRVEVSADGGQTWGCPHRKPNSLIKRWYVSVFWRWDGAPAVLRVRQPTVPATCNRPATQIAAKGTINRYHNPCIQSWGEHRRRGDQCLRLDNCLKQALWPSVWRCWSVPRKSK